MSLLNKIYPSFIKRLDKYLLENKPHIWATNVHKHLFISLSVIVFIIILAIVFPLSLKGEIPDVTEYYSILCFLSFLWFCYLTYKTVLFNKDFNFGIRKWSENLTVFGIYILNISLLVLIPAIFAFILTARIGNLVDDEQFVSDVNNISIGYNYIPKTDLGYINIEDRDDYLSYLSLKKSSRTKDDLELNFTYREIGSIERKEIEKKTHFDFREGGICMRLASFNSFIRSYRGWDYNYDINNPSDAVDFLDRNGLILNYLNNDNSEYRAQKIKEFYEISSKYGTDFLNSYSNVIRELDLCLYKDICLNSSNNGFDFRNHNGANIINSNSNGPWMWSGCSAVYELHSKISYINICKGYSFDFFLIEYWMYGMVGLTFYLSSLLFLFNCVHWKNYLFTLCSILLLLPLLGLMSVFFGFDEFIFLSAYFILFFLGMRIFLRHKRNQVYNFLHVVLTILFFVGLPFFLLIVHFCLDEYINFYRLGLFDFYLNEKANETIELLKVSGKTISDVDKEFRTAYNNAYYNLRGVISTLFFYLGMLLLFILSPLFKSVFNWFLALPRKK